LRNIKCKQQMNKRIKAVWALSVVTAIIVFCAQGYWLYNQLQYNLNRNAEELKEVCNKALDEELSIRSTIPIDTINNPKRKLTTKIGITINDAYDTATVKKVIRQKRRKATTTVTFVTEDSTRKVTFRDFEVGDAMQLSNRYTAQLAKPFGKQLLDSILQSRGYGATSSMRMYKTNHCMVKPKYAVSGTINKTLTTYYSVNPID